MTESDILPLKLCNECIGRLESCHNLVVSTIEMNKTLEEVMKKRQIRNNSYAFVSNILCIDKSLKVLSIFLDLPMM